MPIGMPPIPTTYSKPGHMYKCKLASIEGHHVNFLFGEREDICDLTLNWHECILYINATYFAVLSPFISLHSLS